jgi:hypothetical protein
MALKQYTTWSIAQAKHIACPAIIAIIIGDNPKLP